MNLDQQCCSLELSKRLKDFGVKQESLFYFVKHRKWESTDSGMKEIDPIFKIERWGELTDSEHFSAFTASELGGLLPQIIDQHDDHSPYFLNIHPCTTPSGRCWQMRYGKADHGDRTISITRESLADAFATALIYLLENHLI
jgi:hypothetical protein